MNIKLLDFKISSPLKKPNFKQLLHPNIWTLKTIKKKANKQTCITYHPPTNSTMTRQYSQLLFSFTMASLFLYSILSLLLLLLFLRLPLPVSLRYSRNRHQEELKLRVHNKIWRRLSLATEVEEDEENENDDNTAAVLQ